MGGPQGDRRPGGVPNPSSSGNGFPWARLTSAMGLNTEQQNNTDPRQEKRSKSSHTQNLVSSHSRYSLIYHNEISDTGPRSPERPVLVVCHWLYQRSAGERNDHDDLARHRVSHELLQVRTRPCLPDTSGYLYRYLISPGHHSASTLQISTWIRGSAPTGDNR